MSNFEDSHQQHRAEGEAPKKELGNLDALDLDALLNFAGEVVAEAREQKIALSTDDAKGILDQADRLQREKNLDQKAFTDSAENIQKFQALAEGTTEELDAISFEMYMNGTSNELEHKGMPTNNEKFNQEKTVVDAITHKINEIANLGSQENLPEQIKDVLSQLKKRREVIQKTWAQELVGRFETIKSNYEALSSEKIGEIEEMLDSPLLRSEVQIEDEEPREFQERIMRESFENFVANSVTNEEIFNLCKQLKIRHRDINEGREVDAVKLFGKVYPLSDNNGYNQNYYNGDKIRTEIYPQIKGVAEKASREMLGRMHEEILKIVEGLDEKDRGEAALLVADLYKRSSYKNHIDGYDYDSHTNIVSAEGVLETIPAIEEISKNNNGEVPKWVYAIIAKKLRIDCFQIEKELIIIANEKGVDHAPGLVKIIKNLSIAIELFDFASGEDDDTNLFTRLPNAEGTENRAHRRFDKAQVEDSKEIIATIDSVALDVMVSRDAVLQELGAPKNGRHYGGNFLPNGSKLADRMSSGGFQALHAKEVDKMVLQMNLPRPELKRDAVLKEIADEGVISVTNTKDAAHVISVIQAEARRMGLQSAEAAKAIAAKERELSNLRMEITNANQRSNGKEERLVEMETEYQMAVRNLQELKAGLDAKIFDLTAQLEDAQRSQRQEIVKGDSLLAEKQSLQMQVDSLTNENIRKEFLRDQKISAIRDLIDQGRQNMPKSGMLSGKATEQHLLALLDQIQASM